MRYSSLTQRIAGERSQAWKVHWVAEQRRAAGEDVIFLSVGDPDFATPEPIVDAAVEALRSGDTHYTDFTGRVELRQAIADRFASQSGVSVDADGVVVMAGTQNALFAAGLCLLEAGDEVITFDPMYVTYEATLRATGAELVIVPTADDFRPDPEAVAAAITPRTRAIALTTPANPTGVIATRAELEGLAQLAIDHDLWVLADEVYADLVFDGVHTSIASLEGMAERTVTASSLSKSHAMTGWRVGWAIAPTQLTEHIERLNIANLYGLPGFIQAGAVEALARADAVAADMRATYRRRRDLACDVLADAADLPVLSPAAGMYVMADVRQLGMTSSEFSWALLERKNVSALDAGAFGTRAEGWIRLAFTVGEDRLAESCRRIVEFTHELTERP